jgi:pimeloyl-ACP methyl ester carboxylesterase
MKTENLTSDSKYIPLFDGFLHCKIAGDAKAPALIFLHGNGEDLHIFDSQVRYFSSFYRTICIDTRGHGQSTRGVMAFCFHTFAVDLIDALDELEIDKAHIVGFSDGAAIAMCLSLHAPERVASMVLLGANYSPKGLLLIPRLQIFFVYACLTAASLFSKKMRKRKEIWGLMVYQPFLTIEELSQITVPTLIVTGENDMVSQRHNDEISRAIAGSKRLIIPGGDHFWIFKQPETFNRCIMEFLRETFAGI